MSNMHLLNKMHAYQAIKNEFDVVMQMPVRFCFLLINHLAYETRNGFHRHKP